MFGGHPQVKTSKIDQLAARVMVVTQAHCPAPICGLSRAAVMSGLAPVHNGIYSNDAD